MSAESHERIEEMLAAQALGGLSPAEEAELDRLRAEHGLDCEECLRIEAGYREVAGRLAFALDPAPVREGMEEELFERAMGPRAVPHVDRPGLSRRLVAVAAVVAIFVAGGLGGYLIGRPAGPSADVQTLAAFVAQPDTRVLPFHGRGHGSLKLAFRPGSSTAFVFGSKVPETPSGMIYELWTFRGPGRPIPSGTFSGGDDVVVVPVGTNPAKASAMAVTVERAPGAKQPTTKPIFSAPISV
jgi:hypothetical protein